MLRVLLVGSGGREHALAWKISQSPLCAALYCAPGNPGIAAFATLVPHAVDDIDGIVNFAVKERIDICVIGPELPLVLGLTDALRAKNILVFGPDKAGAQLEGSKRFMKDLCAKYGIPTAAYGCFTDFAKAKEFITAQNLPLVIKADGLAAGKGVIIAQSHEEAIEAAHNMLVGSVFGNAGREIVVEEFLDGEEMSYFALCDGTNAIRFASAQDHKRIGDGDTGLNTGGMGAYTPARMMNPGLSEKIILRLIQPTMDALKSEGIDFVGVLFAGIMIVKGEPILLEYNTRFGDPECEVIMARFDGDLLKLLFEAAKGDILEAQNEVVWKEGNAVCVVLANEGYPGSFKKGGVIRHIETAEMTENVRVFQAGTALDGDGNLIAVGGRVLVVTAQGETVLKARDTAYQAVDLVRWQGSYCRTDIAWRALQ